MYQVLLVEDDVLNRVAIKSMIEWNELGFEISATAGNGKEALEILDGQTIHLVITDIKMPIMDGIELIKEVRAKGMDTCIIVLSSYDEFNLVRQAFKNTIEDYVLKSDLTSSYLKECILKVKSHLETMHISSTQFAENEFKNYATGIRPPVGYQLTNYYCFSVNVCDINLTRRKNFELENGFLSMISEIIRQIPNIKNKSYIIEYNETSILICYKSPELTDARLESLAMQMIQVIKMYSNFDIYIGISDWSPSGEHLLHSISQACTRSSFFWIFGRYSVFMKDKIEGLSIHQFIEYQDNYTNIIESFKALDDNMLFQSQSKLFNSSVFENLETLKSCCLQLIYSEAMFLLEIGDTIWSVWNGKINFKEKLDRLDDPKNITMWMANYNRWLMEYLKQIKTNELVSDDMEIVKRYIKINYGNPSLSLSEVSSIIGLSERYFSNKFKKELGITYVEYLTNIRLEAAKDLLCNTNMKLSDISEAIGYNNVEHFIRLFKKKTGTSPREYGKILPLDS